MEFAQLRQGALLFVLFSMCVQWVNGTPAGRMMAGGNTTYVESVCICKTIPSNSEVGTVVVNLKDAGDGDKQLSYTIHRLPEKFKLDTSTGNIHVSEALDKTEAGGYEMVVTVGDATSIGTVTVTVLLDIECPERQKSYKPIRTKRQDCCQQNVFPYCHQQCACCE